MGSHWFPFGPKNFGLHILTHPEVWMDTEGLFSSEVGHGRVSLSSLLENWNLGASQDAEISHGETEQIWVYNGHLFWPVSPTLW